MAIDLLHLVDVTGDFLVLVSCFKHICCENYCDGATMQLWFCRLSAACKMLKSWNLFDSSLAHYEMLMSCP